MCYQTKSSGGLSVPSWHMLPLRLLVLAHLGCVDNVLDYLCSPSLL